MSNVQIIVEKRICYTLDELQAMVIPDGYAPSKPYFKDVSTEILLGECFRPHPKNNGIEVSNLGRVKYNQTILVQMNDDSQGNGWLYVKVDKVLEKTYVYRLVAETWLELPFNLSGWEVHHLTNDGYDNRPENLMWLRSEVHRMIKTPKADQLIARHC